jgi:hypothetical protein
MKNLFENAVTVKTLFEKAVWCKPFIAGLSFLVVFTMAFELRAGEGAKANILTKTIYPRQSVEDATNQSTVTLICRKGHQYQPEMQRCSTLYFENDQICYTIKRYDHVFEEYDKHENFNSMTNRFGCLSGRFRHGVEHFVTCSEAICAICQYGEEGNCIITYNLPIE